MRVMLYAPEGTAHGYLTLSDDTELLYMTSAKYAPEAATGVRFDDRAFGIRWPRDISVDVPGRPQLARLPSGSFDRAVTFDFTRSE